MLHVEAPTLEHPEVQKAKERFEEKRWNRKIPFTFDELFEFFKADCVRFSAIAKAGGVTKQAVHGLYNRFFRELFRNKNGRDRESTCTLEKTAIRAKMRESKIFSRDSMVRVVQEAKAAEYEVSADSSRLARTRNQLLINDRRCVVHYLTRCFLPSTGSKRRLIRARTTSSVLSAVEFAIFHTKTKEYPERIFIVPADVLRKHYPSSTQGDHCFNLPTEQLPAYNNFTHRIRWWDYENAWHLLVKKPDTPASH